MSENKAFDEFMEKIDNLYKQKPPTYISEETLKEFEPKENDNQINNSIQINSIKKSIKKTKLKKKETNVKIKKVEKSVLIILITTILTFAATFTIPKIITHFEGEQIKKECVDEFYTEIEEKGLNIEELTAEGIINNLTPEYVKENIFEIFQIINDNYKIKEAPKVFNLLVQKAGLANTFDEYLIKEGYFMDIDGIKYPSMLVWENTMEAQKIAEKGAGRGGK